MPFQIQRLLQNKEKTEARVHPVEINIKLLGDFELTVNFHYWHFLQPCITSASATLMSKMLKKGSHLKHFMRILPPTRETHSQVHI